MGSTPTTAHYNLCFNIILSIAFSSISYNKLHATRRIISYCSVHLDARVIPPRCVICNLELDARSNHARHVIYPFRAFTISCNKLHATRRIISYCSVHLDARQNHVRNIIQPFRVFTISCNELHATRRIISYCSVHLDARKISSRLGMKCGGFCACFFVQQVARYGDSRDTRAIDFLSVVWVFEGNKMMWYSESGAPNRT